MFKQIVANLPFNPAQLEQVKPYSKSLQREWPIRRWGFLMLAAAAVVQLLAVLYPATNSLAKADSPAMPTVPSGIKLSKAVSNASQNLTNANDTLARKGDVIQFTMTTTNRSGHDYKNYQARDYFGRVFQYADIASLPQLQSQGLGLDNNGFLVWTVPVLKAGASDVRTVAVKIKSDIPTTNKPAADSADYNCTISNDYGNLVVVKVPCPEIKIIAETAAGLPKSGSGLSLGVGIALAAIAGFLSARARIMSDELELIHRHYLTTGST